MTGALLLAAALPLGLWPDATGPPAAVQEGIEVYRMEPEEDYWVLAVLPLAPPVATVDRASLEPLVTVAARLGADAVLLLAEMPVSEIPNDLETPLVGGPRWAAAAFLLFDCACEEPGPQVFRGRLPAGRAGPPPLSVAGGPGPQGSAPGASATSRAVTARWCSTSSSASSSSSRRTSVSLTSASAWRK